MSFPLDSSDFNKFVEKKVAVSLRSNDWDRMDDELREHCVSNMTFKVINRMRERLTTDMRQGIISFYATENEIVTYFTSKYSEYLTIFELLYKLCKRMRGSSGSSEWFSIHVPFNKFTNDPNMLAKFVEYESCKDSARLQNNRMNRHMRGMFQEDGNADADGDSVAAALNELGGEDGDAVMEVEEFPPLPPVEDENLADLLDDVGDMDFV